MVIGSLFAMGIGAFVYLEERHASRKAMITTELEVREEIKTTDLKRDATAAVYYRNLARERDLSNAELSRQEFIEGQVEQKQEQVIMLQQRILEQEAE
jgi:hypothetical protein